MIRRLVIAAFAATVGVITVLISPGAVDTDMAAGYQGSKTPPAELASAILDALSSGCGIKPRGLLIVEHPSANTHPDTIKQLKRWRTIDHGEKILTIYERI